MLSDWFIQRKNKIEWQNWLCLVFIPWGFIWYIFEKREPKESEFARFRR